MIKVLSPDKLPHEVLAQKFKEAGIDYFAKDQYPQLDLEKLIADCDGLIVRSETKVTADLLDHAPKLKIVGRAGTGYDNIDVYAATARGIVVENTPDANSLSAAEHTMALIYALARNISVADASMKQGEWNRSRYAGAELSGKVLGIIGLGRIGELVARFAKAIGMEVVFHDPFISKERLQGLGYTSLPLEDLLGKSDYVTIHVNLTDETRGMIDAEKLALMRRDTKLLNVARGGLVDENALYDALKSNVIAGAAIDVFEPEPYKPKSPDKDLRKLEGKVILTPHLGASTKEAQDRVARQIAEQIVLFFREKRIINSVNAREFSQDIKPYLGLVERMGYLARTLVQGPISEVRLACYGGIASSDISGISSVGLVGLLSGQVDSINIVNAPQIAHHRGIRISEERPPEQTDYRNMIGLEVLANGAQPVNVRGILFEGKTPRIVGLNGYTIEFEPDGTLLMTSHKDVPGVAGYIGTVLGKHQINIATINLSRESQGGKAIAVLKVDSSVPQEVIREIVNDTQKRFYDARQIVIPTKLSPIL